MEVVRLNERGREREDEWVKQEMEMKEWQIGMQGLIEEVTWRDGQRELQRIFERNMATHVSK